MRRCNYINHLSFRIASFGNLYPFGTRGFGVVVYATPWHFSEANIGSGFEPWSWKNWQVFRVLLYGFLRGRTSHVAILNWEFPFQVRSALKKNVAGLAHVFVGGGRGSGRTSQLEGGNVTVEACARLGHPGHAPSQLYKPLELPNCQLRKLVSF